MIFENKKQQINKRRLNFPLCHASITIIKRLEKEL